MHHMHEKAEMDIFKKQLCNIVTLHATVINENDVKFDFENQPNRPDGEMLERRDEPRFGGIQEF